jgi:hypothetical protein
MTAQVPERCTCGAVLPPDALFCHKCGKPQREDLLVQPEAETPAPLPPPPLPAAAPPPIGFHNGAAVRIALLAGASWFLVSALIAPLVPLRPLALVWPIIMGFLAVLIYRRRTGQRLTALNGAHLGWICGIFGFVIVAITVTLRVVAEPSLFSTLTDQLRAGGMSEADVNQFVSVLRTPAGVAGVLIMSFLLFTVLPAFGGLIGAKLLDRD